ARPSLPRRTPACATRVSLRRGSSSAWPCARCSTGPSSQSAGPPAKRSSLVTTVPTLQAAPAARAAAALLDHEIAADHAAQVREVRDARGRLRDAEIELERAV